MAQDNKEPNEVADKRDPHSKENRILARAAAAKTPEYPLYPSSETTGVLPLSITGRFRNERERLGPDFTEADRVWRVKWHKDQQLHANEPYHVPELASSLNNPIRRFYKAPLNYVQDHILAPRIGHEWACITRKWVGLFSLTYVASLFLYYNIKYHHNTWEKPGGIRVMFNKPEVLPGDPRYPLQDPRPEPEDHYDRGFKGRRSFLHLS